MREKWNAGNIDRQKELLIKLSKGDSSFTELYESLKRGWARETLNVYLKSLVRKQYIKRVPKVPGGSRMIYFLVRDHTDVKDILERVDLRELHEKMSERELLDDWIESMNFSLLNIIQTYMEMGMGEKKLISLGTGARARLETGALHRNLW